MPRKTSKATRRAIGAVAATVVFLAILLPFSCIPRPKDRTLPPSKALKMDLRTVAARPVRILLVDAEPSATIGTTSTYRIVTADDSATLLVDGSRHSLPETTVKPTANGIEVGGHAFPHRAIRLEPTRDGALVVGSTAYRGRLIIRRDADEALSVLNLLPVESYLYSVLGSETYAGWPAAALEAQAVISRTYALWRMVDRAEKPFDLHASVKDQSYQGTAKEDPRLRAAVDRTAGVVLLYQSRLFRCYYHSTCGGHTAAVENYFPDLPLLPLSGAKCGYCSASKHYRWTRDVLKSDLSKKLEADGLPIHRIDSIEVTSRTRSGRAREIAVVAEGVRHVVSGGKFRQAVGASEIPSTHFEVRDSGSSVEFRGRGWGHGVGLCQWGSKGMAEAGLPARDILRHYYPGTALTRLYNP